METVKAAPRSPPAPTVAVTPEPSVQKILEPAEARPREPRPSDLQSSDSKSSDDVKREHAIKECLAKSRALQDMGDLDGALSRVKAMLVNYPGEPRLIQLQETVVGELEVRRREIRRHALDDLRKMELEAATTDKIVHEALIARSRAVASKYPGDAEVLSASERVFERISKVVPPKQNEAERLPSSPPTPKAGPPKVETTAVTPQRPPSRPAVPTPPVREVAPPLPPARPPRAIPPAPTPQPPRPPGPSSFDKMLKEVKALNFSARLSPYLSRLTGWVRTGRGKIVLGAVLGVVALAIGISLRKTPPPKPSLPPSSPAASLLSVRIRTSPPGATIRINNEVRGVSNLQLDLPAGNYQVEADLNGYQSAKASLEAKSGSSDAVDLTLQPALPMVKLSSDTGVGKVMLDDLPPVDLAGEQRTLEDIGAGEHKLKFEGPQGSASFSFSTSPGNPPAVTGPIAANRVVAVVVANLGSEVHVYCSEPSAEGSLDDQPSAKVSQQGLQLPNVPMGVHQLLIKAAGEQYKVAIEAGPIATLSTFLQSGRNIGTLLVMTHEDGVKVSSTEYRRRLSREAVSSGYRILIRKTT